MIPTRSSFRIAAEDLAELSPYAVEMRYPGKWLMETREEAVRAFEIASRIRMVLRPLLTS